MRTPIFSIDTIPGCMGLRSEELEKTGTQEIVLSSFVPEVECQC